MTEKQITGPVEDTPWPTTLEAHVVDPGPPRRIHGYEAHGDLARHHSFGELALLAFTGELPDAAATRRFDLALCLLAPVAITEAATHATVLARLLAAPDANVVAIAATLAAERAEHIVVAHRAWLAWCAAPETAPPAEFLAGADDTIDVVRARLEAECIDLGALQRCRPTTTATALALLHAAGLQDPLQLVAAIVHASLPCMIAEAQRTIPLNLRRYPMGVPPFDYEEGPE